jgi:uncharacterized protein DUF4926
VLHERDSAVLACDLSEYGLKRGDVGTVVLVHKSKGYEVEFMTLDGETLTVASLARDQVRAIRRREIAHARAVENSASRS